MKNSQMQVSGIVVKKTLKRYYPYRNSTKNHYVPKWTVQDENGNKFWGTVPKFAHETQVGDSVTFKCEVTGEGENNYFFYKKPKK